MKYYCNNFKKSVINYYNKHKSIKKVIDTYEICRKTLYNWRQKDNKSILYTNFKYKKQISKKYNKNILDYIEKYIINKDNFRMKLLLKNIRKNFQLSFNANNIYYALRKLGITYKKAHKVVRINRKKHKKDVNNLKNNIQQIGKEKIISTDECHFQTNMKPNKGWNKKGKRVTFVKNSGKRINVSLICSITKNRVLHYKIYKSSVDKKVFINYIKHINKKSNRKHILLDNARVHHSKDLKKYMKDKSNKLLYNVPYNPETNPIEQVFNKVKAYVRKQNTTTCNKLLKAIINGLKIITPANLSYYYSNSFDT